MNVTRTCLAATLAGAAMIACSAGPSGSTVYVVSSGWVGTDGGAVGATPAGTSECLPADVASLLDAKCAACHGDPPLASALSGLMTAADLEAPSKLDPTSNEAEESLALMALTGGVKAMPPGTGSPTADITVLKSWISAGYPTVACGATSSSGAGSSTTSTGGGSAGVPGVPCDVSTMLAASCTGCHGDPPLASALAGLVTLADLKATSKLDPTKNEAEESVALMTLTSGTKAMPPGSGSSAANIAILQSWINGGYAPGTACASTGSSAGVFAGAPAFVATTGRSTHNAGQNCLQCHSGKFMAGGTVYDASGAAVVGAEVRLVDANSKATSVYTSSSGTFYMSGSSFAGPAHIGVRTAKSVQNMITPLQSGSQPPASSGGACGACHCKGGSCTISAVHLP